MVVAAKNGAMAGAPTVEIVEIKKGEVTMRVRGTSPLILNRMSEKARRELLMPKGRKTAADKAANLKHVPLDEFRASPYTIRDENAPTYIALTAGTFKGAMGTAALDLPGARKAQIGRLVYVEAQEYRDLVPIYGEPQLLMSVVRSADMNHTPDIRSRMIIPEWAAEITISYVLPTIREQAIVNLLAAAGITAGVGDWRPEKGAGSYGQFVPVSEKDPKYLQIVKQWGRKQQIEAMEHPRAYDLETEELLTWFDAEAPRRGFEVVA